MNRMVAVTAALLALSFASTAGAAASVEIRNRSSWELHNLYIGPAGDPDWGPDQLRDDVIPVDTTFTLNKIACGNYDIRVVDEDGDACDIYDVRLCSDKVWDLTDEELLNCQANTESE